MEVEVDSQNLHAVHVLTGLGFIGFRVWGLGFGVWGLGLGVWGLGFGVWGFGVRVWGLGFGVENLLLLTFLSDPWNGYSGPFIYLSSPKGPLSLQPPTLNPTP